MKRVLLGMTAIGLAGCNWGGSNHNQHYQHGYQYGGYYGHNGYQNAMPVRMHGSQQINNRTAIEFSAGAEEFTGGNILPRVVGTGGQINKVEYKDAYDTAWRATGGISYDVAPRTTLVARGFYKQAQSADDTITGFTGNGGTAVTGNFSDMNSYGAEVGFREYLSNHNGPAKLRPYMGATVGAAYLESVDFENGSANGNAFAGPIEVFDNQWVPTASAVVGLEMPVSSSFSMGVESGLRYEGKRESDTANFETTDAYSVPVTLRGRFRF
ncbi:MAG: hypothetical protein HKN36_05610 [Hellea sp.]|nr:hypothetical protein [Hellea sp.]